MPAELLTERWMATYLAPIPPVDLSGLKPRHVDDEEDGAGNVCNLPHTRLPRGRPRKVRMDKGQYRASRGAGGSKVASAGWGCGAGSRAGRVILFIYFQNRVT
jgi:hypothetical protein